MAYLFAEWSGSMANFSWCGRAGIVVPFVTVVRARRAA
jgi:hypothetical protein